MVLKQHKKKSGKKIWAVKESGKILYSDQSKGACERYIKLHSK